MKNTPVTSRCLRLPSMWGVTLSQVKCAATCCRPASPIENRNLLSAVLSSCRWQQLRAEPREPIYREAAPFVHGSIGSPQPLAHRCKWVQRIVETTCAPIDGIGFDRKARFAEDTDCPGHVIS